MLKIKDNVDLKELEKYGITQYSRDGYSIIYDEAELLVDKLDDKRIVVINTYEDGEDYIYNQALDKLYDLIKDGLVVKVDE